MTLVLIGHARITATLAIHTPGDEDEQRAALGGIAGLLFGRDEGR